MNAKSVWIHFAQLGLHPFPTALQFFRHYLFGRGQPVHVNLNTLLQEEPGLMSALGHELALRQRAGETEGTVYVPQPAFRCWNWRLALGGLNLHWKQINQDILLAFAKTYQWNACTRRISRPIHRAAAAEARKGTAQSFPIVGKPIRLSLQSLESCPPPRKARFLGRLYL